MRNRVSDSNDSSKPSESSVEVGGRYRLARAIERAWTVGEGTLLKVVAAWGSTGYTVDVLEGPMRGFRFQVKASDLVPVTHGPTCISAPLTADEEAAAEEWESRLPR